MNVPLAPTTGAPRPRGRASSLVAAHAPLLRALLRRDLRAARLALALAATAAGAAALGHHLARRGLLAAAALAPHGASSPAPAAFGAAGGAADGPLLADAAAAGGALAAPEAVALALLAHLLPLPIAAGAAWLVIDHVAADHEGGWLAPLVAGALSGARVAYLLAVLAGVVVVAVPLGATATLALLMGAGLPPADAAVGALRRLPGIAAFTVALCCYAAACAVLVRRRRRALLVAVLGVVGPLAAVAWWQGSAGAPPPSPVVALLGAHLPPLGWSSEPGEVGRRALYAAVVLSLLVVAAPRLVAREP